MSRNNEQQMMVDRLYSVNEDSIIRITDKTLREPFINSLKALVAETIQKAREGSNTRDRLEAATILLDSLNAAPSTWEHSFALWTARIGKLLGTTDCYEIGTSVCKQENFSIDEATHLVGSLSRQLEQEEAEKAKKKILE